MANKIMLARGTKARIEAVKGTLNDYELVYSLDTQELGVKNDDGTVTYFGVVTELEWTNILNKPNFSTVATSGAYGDLSGLPNLDLKLDKNFATLPNQATPLLTDVMVLNRGATVQKTTLGALLALVDTEIFIVVATLPASGVANKIYLVPKSTPELNDGYDEFIWKDGKWELLGSLTLDLSNYYNKSEVDGLLSAKVNANNPITAGTKAKITYDAKGLVIAGADLAATDIPNLDAAKIATGTFADSRIPNLNASKINAGTFGADRIPQLSASKISQNAMYRFVTDEDKEIWNLKLSPNSIIDGGDL